jgi:hypothetical protein
LEEQVATVFGVENETKQDSTMKMEVTRGDVLLQNVGSPSVDCMASCQENELLIVMFLVMMFVD